VNKNSWEAHRDLAQVWLARGDYVKAESLLKTAVQQNPDDPLAHRILAELYRRTNRPDLAGRELDLFHKLSSVSSKEMESGAGETGKSDSPPEH
jgi:Tfp pilus assembly protein PilF